MRALTTILFLLNGAALAQPQVYTPIAATSKVAFRIKNFGTAVNGTFAGLNGAIRFDASSPTTAEFDVSVSTATVDTGNGLRDRHLRKPDYLDASGYPTIHFVSSTVEKQSGPNEAGTGQGLPMHATLSWPTATRIGKVAIATTPCCTSRICITKPCAQETENG